MKHGVRIIAITYDDEALDYTALVTMQAESADQSALIQMHRGKGLLAQDAVREACLAATKAIRKPQ